MTSTDRARRKVSRPKPRRWGLVVAAALATSIVSTPQVVAPRAADAATPSPAVRVLGTIPLLEPEGPITDPGVGGDGVVYNVNYDENGQLLINPRTRRGYQVFVGGNGTGVNDDILTNVNNDVRPTILRSFHLDTLQPRERVVLPRFYAQRALNSKAPGDVAHAVDERGGRIFVAGYGRDHDAVTPQGRAEVTRLRIAIIDEAKFDRGEAGAVVFRDVPLTQPELQRKYVVGLTYFEEGDRGKLLVALSKDTSIAVKNLSVHTISQWDVDTFTADWSYVPQACLRGHYVSGPGEHQWLTPPLVRGADALYVPCSSPSSGIQVVKVALDARGQPISEQPFALPRPVGSVFADPGSERLFFEGALSGVTWWAFDGRAESFVGSAGVSQSPAGLVGGGVDPDTGRAYALVPDHTRGNTREPVQGGLFLADMRLTPTPQFQNVLPDFAWCGQFRITVDPAREGRPRRLFIRRGNNTCPPMPDYPGTDPVATRPLEDHYFVLEDTIPVSVAPPPEDVDAKTSGFAPTTGLTEERFDASGSAFGFRSLLVGGLNALASKDLDGGLRDACYRTDRELVVGAAPSAYLSDLVAGAEGVSLHVDRSTKADLDTPASRCYPSSTDLVPDLPGVVPANVDAAAEPWDESDLRAACVGDEPAQSVARDDAVQTYRADVTCSQAEGTVASSASGAAAPSATSPIRVASAGSRVDVRRDLDRGVVVRAEAYAYGIEILGVGTIGEVTTVAESWAGGVAGSAGTSFTRRVCGIDIDGFTRPACDEGPGAVTALNRALGNNGRARLRTPDPVLATGSPGGFLAGVQRHHSEEFEDRVVTRDNALEVPGLEITFTRADDPVKGTGRQVFQFAAVKAATSFGTTCLYGEKTDGSACAGSSSLEKTVVPTAPLVAVDGTGAAEISLQGVGLEPLAGGRFGVSADGRLIGECRTGANGACRIDDLPLGAYTAEQLGAPAGFQAVDDAPTFRIGRPGQVVRLGFVNDALAPSARPVVAGVQAASVEPTAPPPTFLDRLLQAPVDALRFLLAHPGEAVLMAGVWSLFWGWAYLSERRRSLVALSESIGSDAP